ncbi:MAG: pantoate--beta-alanine ligase [Actinomycetota bacterium]|nr:pantoate--beta-alanine ligase [Actinomycetota bacterium]
MTLEQVDTISELRVLLDERRRAGSSVGFVPTMGYLHDGHVSLMSAARAETDVVVASVFVNPLQFAANEDLAGYPRDLERDATLADGAGVDLLFTPSVEEMYPRPVATAVSLPELSQTWEGATRPTHFDGMATVVSKLFNIVGPCHAYFGEKDYQQLQIIRRMVADLSIPVEVRGCPIVRESDGLAMSSRNTYLDADQRGAAPVLRGALDAGLALLRSGERDALVVIDAMAAVVQGEPLAQLDYAAAVDAATLVVPKRLQGEVRLLIAAQVGRPRLLDNDGLTLDDESSSESVTPAAGSREALDRKDHP